LPPLGLGYIASYLQTHGIEAILIDAIGNKISYSQLKRIINDSKPNFLGINIFSPDFTPEELRRRAAEHPRMQVRVLINDRTILDSIGNAYADEILFAAQIHPKTLAGTLHPDEWVRLHGAIRDVMSDGVRAVADARQPIHIKVRDHMRVRNRKGSPCPRCGSTIRREGVRGYDVFFCPTCQPARRRVFIDWKQPPPADSPDALRSDTDQSA